MKKIILSIIACTFIYTSGVVATTINDVSTMSTALFAKGQRVTVYMIKKQGNFTSSTRKSGIYDAETNQITIGNYTYNVSRNPYYGDGTKRGAYKYIAGSYYFFDL